MATKAFSMIDAYMFGLRTLGKNFLLILGIFAVSGLAMLGIILFIHTWLMPLEAHWTRIAEVTSSSFNFGFKYMLWPEAPIELTPLQALILLVASVLLAAIVLMIKMSLLRIGLDTYDRGNSTFQQIKSTLPFMGTFYLTTLLIYLATMIGFILIIPGLIFLVKYGYGDFVVLDSDLGPIEAMKRSSELTYGHKWRIFGFYMLSFFLIAMSSILIVGPLIFLFVFLFSRAYVYRKLVENFEQFEPIPPIP